VFDRCVAAREYVRASSPHTADEKRECILALLTFAADYCFEHQLRLYLYADQLNAFQKDELDQFPFSILTSQVIRKWSARGAIVITAVSANNNVDDEVRHFGVAPNSIRTFVSRFSASDLPVFLNTMLSGVIEPADDDVCDLIADYTGLLPLECKNLADFIIEEHGKKQPLPPAVGPAVDPAAVPMPVPPPLDEASWMSLLRKWSTARATTFMTMLQDFDARFIAGSESRREWVRNAARLLELNMPVPDDGKDLLYDRRLIFAFTQSETLPNGDTVEVKRLDASSHLARQQMLALYPAPLVNEVSNIETAMGALLSDDGNLVTNDTKGRVVEAYILHRIRQLVAAKAESIKMTLMVGGDPWRTETIAHHRIKFKFKTADVVVFRGNKLPPASALGNISRPKYFIPVNSNYPQFDFFYFRPGKFGTIWNRYRPSKLYRLSITVSLSGHSYEPTVADLSAWQNLIDPAITKLSGANGATPIPLLAGGCYVWIAPRKQTAPNQARGKTQLLALDTMADDKFPMLMKVNIKE